MYSSSQREEAIASLHSQGASGACLPIELFLAIVDSAIAQHRKGSVYWCLSLSLVCRTVRATVLPVMYNVLFLDIKASHESQVRGWDGQIHRHAQLAFLSWLLHDPIAPPRQHIRHLVFRSDSNLDYRELAWQGPHSGPEPAMWSFDCLSAETARLSGDAKFLYRAGLRPRRAFLIGDCEPNYRHLNSELFSRALLQSFLVWMTLTEIQVWAAQPTHVSNGLDADTTRVGHSSMARYEIDPRTVRSISEMREADSHLLSNHATIQLVDGDYLQQFPDQLLTGLATVLKQKPDIRIVLACSSECRLAGQTVSQFIRGAVPTTLPMDSLDGRIRVSHTAWAPILVEKDTFHALAQALCSGGDPWNEGYGA